MKYRSRLKQCLCIFIGLFTLAGSAQEEAKVVEVKENAPALRILCVAVLPGAENIMLASKDEAGEWTIITEEAVKIRSKFVTEWLPAEKGTMYLVKKTGDVVESLGSFIYPVNAKRLVIVLLPNVADRKYRIDVIDPSALGFSKGKALVANYSQQSAVAKLGAAMSNVESGNKVVIKPIPEENGMYRMTLGYIDDKSNPIPCYDRYVEYSEESRDFLLLFPDRRQPGFAVFSLAEFGPFE